MAKKDEFGLDDDFNLDDFGNENSDFGADPFKDDREPLTKIASNFADAAKETATDPSFLRRFIMRALPHGYGQAFALFDRGAETARELYNNASKDLEPAEKEIRETLKRQMPGIQKNLPKGMADRVDRYIKDAEERERAGKPFPVQSDEANLQLELGNIFKTSVALQARQGAQETVERRLSDQVRTEQHEKLMGVVGTLQDGISRLVGYQDQVTSKYQQKSLELSYRKYFVLRDLFTHQKAVAEDQKLQLKAIVHNTGLPDVQKVQAKEALGEMIRGRILDAGMRGVSNFSNSYMEQLKRNFNNLIKEKTSSANNLFTSLLGAGNQLGDMGEMAGGTSGILGSFLGSSLVENLGNLVADELRPGLDKVEGVRKYGAKASYYSENYAELLNEFAKGNKYDDLQLPLGSRDPDSKWNFGSVSLNPLVQLLKWTLPKYYLNDSIQSDTVGRAQDIAQFDNMTRKSIVEVIPGFLSRILQSLEITRTGNPNVERVVWNYERDEFTAKSTASRDLFDRMFTRTRVDLTNDDLDRIINNIDPDKTLSNQARNELARQLMRDVASGKAFDPRRMAQEGNYVGGIDPAVREELLNRFRTSFDVDAEGRYVSDTADNAERVAHLARQFKYLQANVPDAQLDIQRQVNVGNQELLRELGLVTKVGTQDRVNFERVWNIYQAGRDESGNSSNEPYESSTPIVGDAGLGFMGPPRPGTFPSVPSAPDLPSLSNRPVSTTARGVKQDCECFDRFTVTFEDNMQRLLDAVKANNTVEEAQQTAVMVGDAIQLLGTIAATGMGQMAGGVDANGAPLDAAALRRYLGITDNKWYNRFKKATKFSVKKGSKAIWGLAEATGKMYTGMFRGIGRATQGVGTLVGATGRILGRGLLKSDIFVRGRREPALTYAKLREGHYYDVATGKIIRRLGDINGPVKDNTDPDNNFVLTEEDIRRGLYDNTGRSILSNLGRGVSAMLRGTGRMYGALFAPIPAAVNALSRLTRSTYSYLTREKDVYVSGERTPRLLVSVMNGGGYFSAKTQQPIRSFTDIDGDVVDVDGNVVLSVADMSKGLVDRNGRRIERLSDRLFGLAGKAIRAPIRLGMGVLKGYATMARGIAKLIGGAGVMGGNILRRLFRPWGNKGDGGQAMDTAALMLLEGIYNVLNDRLPDSGGVRKGSWQEQLAEKAQAAKDKLTKTVPERVKAVKNPLTGIAAWVKEKMERNNPLKQLFGGDDEEEGGWLDKAKDYLGDRAEDILGGGDDEDGTDRRGRRRGRKRGARIRARARVGKQAAKGAFDTLKGQAGRLLGKIGLGTAGRAGLGAAATVATTVGGEAALGGLAAGGAALGGGLLAFLTAPATLAVGAAALVGVAGYYGYKYLTRQSVGDLTRVRMTQYGIDPGDESAMNKVAQLEAALRSEVQTGPSGASLSDRLDLAKLLGIFGVDTTDEEAANSWLTWFVGRFKPVFLSWVTVGNALAPNVSLAELDSKVDATRKLEMLERVQSFGGRSPYLITASPFDADDELPTDQPVMAAIKLAKANLAAAKDKPSTATDMIAKAGIPTAAAATLRPANTATVSTDRFAELQGAALLQATVTGPSKTGVRVTGAGLSDLGNAGGRLDAVSCVRFKTYGLKALDIDKVRALQGLERDVLAAISYGGDGKAQFNDDGEKYLHSRAAAFGVGLGDQQAVLDWLVWFSNRFVPVFVNYCTAVRQLNKAANPLDLGNRLTPEQLLDVAQLINATVTTNQNRSVSVWTLQTSPWPLYGLNTDATSIQVNLDALNEQIRNRKYQETTGSGAKPTPSTGPGQNLVQTVMPNAARGVDFSRSPSMMAVNQQAAAQRGSTPFLSSITKAGGASLETLTTGGGRAVQHPGNGRGGDINELPEAKGNGWSNVKDLIIKAAKMVGVDSGLMATMASIESGFRATVKAGTSSATGLYQFISSTWNDMIKRFGPKYGIAPGTPATDPRANALMGAEFLKENSEKLQRGLGRAPTDTDLYMAHFLGPAGAIKFLQADPNASAAQVMGNDVAAANRSIFFDGGRARTVAEVYQVMNNKVRGHSEKYGAEAIAASGQTPSSTAATPNDTSNGSSTVAAAGSGATPSIPGITPAAPGAGPLGMLKVNSASSNSSGGPLLAPAPMTNPASSSGLQAVTSKDDAVVQAAQQQSERQATSQQVQGKMSSDVMVDAMISLQDIMSRQLAYTQSMDSSLKEIAANIRVMGEAAGKGAPAPVVAAAPAEDAVVKGKTAQSSTPRLSPIPMRRTS